MALVLVMALALHPWPTVRTAQPILETPFCHFEFWICLGGHGLDGAAESQVAFYANRKGPPLAWINLHGDVLDWPSYSKSDIRRPPSYILILSSSRLPLESQIKHFHSTAIHSLASFL